MIRFRIADFGLAASNFISSFSISEREIITNEETEFKARNPHSEFRIQQDVVLLTTHCTSNMI
jgi:hypothetical protein